MLLTVVLGAFAAVCLVGWITERSRAGAYRHSAQAAQRDLRLAQTRVYALQSQLAARPVHQDAGEDELWKVAAADPVARRELEERMFEELREELSDDDDSGWRA